MVQVGKDVTVFVVGDKACPLVMQGHHFVSSASHVRTSGG